MNPSTPEKSSWPITGAVIFGVFLLCTISCCLWTSHKKRRHTLGKRALTVHIGGSQRPEKTQTQRALNGCKYPTGFDLARYSSRNVHPQVVRLSEPQNCYLPSRGMSPQCSFPSFTSTFSRTRSSFAARSPTARRDGRSGHFPLPYYKSVAPATPSPLKFAFAPSSEQVPSGPCPVQQPTPPPSPQFYEGPDKEVSQGMAPKSTVDMVKLQVTTGRSICNSDDATSAEDDYSDILDIVSCYSQSTAVEESNESGNTDEVATVISSTLCDSRSSYSITSGSQVSASIITEVDPESLLKESQVPPTPMNFVVRPLSFPPRIRPCRATDDLELKTSTSLAFDHDSKSCIKLQELNPSEKNEALAKEIENWLEKATEPPLAHSYPLSSWYDQDAPEKEELIIPVLSAEYIMRRRPLCPFKSRFQIATKDASLGLPNVDAYICDFQAGSVVSFPTGSSESTASMKKSTATAPSTCKPFTPSQSITSIASSYKSAKSIRTLRRVQRIDFETFRSTMKNCSRIF